MADAILDGWLSEPYSAIVDAASVSAVRARAREVAASGGLPLDDVRRVATIAGELAENQRRHARRGRLALRLTTRGERVGVEVIAADAGEGIADPTGVLARAPDAGLACVRRQASEVDVDVRVGEGACIRARIFHGEVPRRRQVGIYGRPFRGEARSGDHALFVRSEEALTFGVCDGLGHGAHARAASLVALDVFSRSQGSSPAEILEACHRALARTRGAAMTVATVAEPDGSVELAAVGNVNVDAVVPRHRRRFSGAPSVLGGAGGPARPRVDRTTIETGETILTFTDGIKSSAAIEGELRLLHDHPIVVAHQLVERFAREGDDVLVLVAR